jgi:hypothetical protein
MKEELFESEKYLAAVNLLQKNSISEPGGFRRGRPARAYNKSDLFVPQKRERL